MPLRLKSLELHGYKTFAVSANFEFAKGITAIVGPNGSGKSNIADAMRWVLGEQSYSLLRAKKTEDMIYAGSELRPRAGMASATMVFDNTNGWLPVDFAEVAVTRRAYRDGHNEYLLNGQQVRLKDIFELLAQSGLSERTYTILGQGLVDASLALKADERRRLFEEAAGIGLYRTRREEALRRLDATKRNLERALDIMAELEPRLKSLERQARRAQEFSQIQDDLRVLLRDWYGYHWHNSQLELTSARDLAREFENKTQESRQSYQAVRSTFGQARDRSQGLRARLNSWHRDSSQTHDQRSTVIRELAVRDERLHALMDNQNGLSVERIRLEQEEQMNTARVHEAENELTRLVAELDESKVQLEDIKESLKKKQQEKDAQEQQLLEARKILDGIVSNRTAISIRVDELNSRIAVQKKRLEDVSRKVSDAEEEMKKAGEQYQGFLNHRNELDALEKESVSLLQQAHQELAALEAVHKEQVAKEASVQAERAGLQAQVDVLDQAETSLAGYAEGARMILDAARKQKLSGARGALSSALDVQERYETAIAAALGEYTDAIVFRSGSDTDGAIELLRKDSAGRASLLPLDLLTPVEMKDPPAHPDSLGLASRLVNTPVELRPAIDVLLGRVLVVKDHQAAREVLPDMPEHSRVVTLDGEIYHASGQILAGKPAYAAALSRPRQRRELKEALDLNDRQLEKIRSELTKVESQINAARGKREQLEIDHRDKQSALAKSNKDEQQARLRLDTYQKQLELQRNILENLDLEIASAEQDRKSAEDQVQAFEAEFTRANDDVRAQSHALEGLTLDDVQSQAAYWSTRMAVAEQAVDAARRRVADLVQVGNVTKDQLNALEKRTFEIISQREVINSEKNGLHLQERELNERLAELQALIEPAEKELENTEAQEARQQVLEAESQQALATVERQFSQVQMDLARKQEALEVLRQRIEDDFGLVNFEYQSDVSGPVPLPFEGMVEELRVLTELPPDLEENLTRQRALLRRMGPVNPEAQQEFEAVKQRHVFMKEQIEDLNKADADLHQVIAELDELTKTAFFKTFSAVAEEFHDIFHRLFGGGSARLVLTDPENLTETGIDIEARLPGRREQGLSLLSGGERSLTAIALVFALLKVSPTPVCVMDEVDAMLDEANVGRFRDLLSDLSQATQFVIITHNRNTVQAADVIYGVTMGRDSSSQVISLRLDEISEDYLK